MKDNTGQFSLVGCSTILTIYLLKLLNKNLYLSFKCLHAHKGWHNGTKQKKEEGDIIVHLSLAVKHALVYARFGLWIVCFKYRINNKKCLFKLTGCL